MREPLGDSRETLLCVQFDNGDFEAALCLSPQPLARLIENDPFVHLGEHNFADFCVAVEGISHFLNVAFAHADERPLPVIELEWQAEIDKYCLALLLLHAQRPVAARLPYDLFFSLFVRFTLHGEVARAHPVRYAQANRAAAQVCHRWLVSGMSQEPSQLVEAWRAVRAWDRAAKLSATFAQ